MAQLDAERGQEQDLVEAIEDLGDGKGLSYDALIGEKEISYSAGGIPVLPREDEDDEYWPEYDNI
jgi:hypothetical protein